jgi:hypothetical protein
MVLNRAFVSVGGTDISDFVESVELNFSAETDAAATMGDDTAVVVATRKNWSLTVQAINDYTAATGLDAIMWPLANALAPVTIIVRPDKNSSVGVNNPNYTGSAVITGYNPISGSHGSQSRTPINFAPSGSLTRATS